MDPAMFGAAGLLLICLGSAPTFAGDFPYVEVTCSKEAGQLIIKELSVDDEKLIPAGKQVQSLIAMTEIKTIDGPAGKQDHRVRKRNYRTECEVAGAKYRVQVAPWNFNPRVNGMCGGYAPSTELTVWRGKERLVNHLVFSGFCNPPDSDLSIETVSLNEATKTAEISVNSSKGRADERVPFSELKKIKRQQLLR
jgi:hypothetical protein